MIISYEVPNMYSFYTPTLIHHRIHIPTYIYIGDGWNGAYYSTYSEIKGKQVTDITYIVYNII